MQKKLRGDDDWMLPAVARKIELQSTEPVADKSKSKKAKKQKKSKKSKKVKKSKKKKYSSDSDSESSSSDEERIKKRKKRKDSSESDEWVESAPQLNAKKPEQAAALPVVQRDDWMSGMLMPTYTKEVKPKKDDRKTIDSYDPKLSARELNPFWRNGGTGLPTFQKPSNDSDEDEQRKNRHQQRSRPETFRGNWRKKNDSPEPQSRRERQRSQSPDRQPRRHRSPTPEWGRKAGTYKDDRSPKRKEICSSASSSRSPTPVRQSISHPVEAAPPKSRIQDFMTDQQMNELGAKILKAEIMGDDELAKSLAEKLESARKYRTDHKHELIKSRAVDSQARKAVQKEEVLLTATNSQGFSRPLQKTATASSSTAASDPWGGRGKRGNKKAKKVETHAGGERIRYFADDDKYDIKQMVSLAGL